MGVLQFAVIAVVLFVVVFLIWRLVSNRQSLPCPSWLGWMVELDNPFTKTNRAGVIISLLGLRPGMKVLDAGCGPGRLAIPGAQAIGPQGELTALDLQPAMLARVQEKARAAGLTNIRLVQAGLGEGQLEKDYYDRALLVTVLGEIPDQEAALWEIHAALKPGGILSVTEVIFDSGESILFRDRKLEVPDVLQNYSQRYAEKQSHHADDHAVCRRGGHAGRAGGHPGGQPGGRD